jgi:hypothetical protein
MMTPLNYFFVQLHNIMALDAIGLRWLTVMNVTTLWHIGTHSARFF